MSSHHTGSRYRRDGMATRRHAPLGLYIIKSYNGDIFYQLVSDTFYLVHRSSHPGDILIFSKPKDINKQRHFVIIVAFNSFREMQ